MRKLTIGRLFFALLVAVFLLFFARVNTFAQGVKIEGKTIDYTLAYPGILPDHPLYFIKSVRDNLLYFLTRDNIKKAKRNLEFSDKKARMAIDLSKIGKWNLAVTTIIDGEKDFLKIPKLLTIAKSQGAGSSESLILTLKLANEKHREVIESLLKEAPQGESKRFDEVITLNKNIQKQIEKL